MTADSHRTPTKVGKPPDTHSRSLLLLALAGLLVLFVYTKMRFDSLEEQTSNSSATQFGMSYLPPQLKHPKKPPLLTWKSVYVPTNSRLYFDGGKALPLDTTLVLRNPSSTDPLYVQAIDYFSGAEEKLRSYTAKVFELGPLEQVEFLAEAPKMGDVPGTHFVVRWGASRAQVRPLVEAIMVDRSAQVVLRQEGVRMRHDLPIARRPTPRRGSEAVQQEQ